MLDGQYTALAREGDHANHQQQASTTDNTELAVVTLLLRHELLAAGSNQHALDLDGLRQHQVAISEPLNVGTAERKRLLGTQPGSTETLSRRLQRRPDDHVSRAQALRFSYPGPVLGATVVVMVGVATYVKRSALLFALLPPTAATVTCTVPAVPAGDSAVIDVAERP